MGNPSHLAYLHIVGSFQPLAIDGALHFKRKCAPGLVHNSLTDIHKRQELQKDGLLESVLHILYILEEEARPRIPNYGLYSVHLWKGHAVYLPRYLENGKF